MNFSELSLPFQKYYKLFILAQASKKRQECPMERYFLKLLFILLLDL